MKANQLISGNSVKKTCNRQDTHSKVNKKGDYVMNVCCCTYELSEEELDDVNGGFLGALVVAAFAFGVYQGYQRAH
jgi:hypothetical protein